MLIHLCFPLWYKALSCPSAVPILHLFFIVTSFISLPPPVGPFPLSMQLTMPSSSSFFLRKRVQRIPSHREDACLGTKVQCCRQCVCRISICVAFYWFLLCECANAHIWQQLCPYFITCTHTHTQREISPWQYWSHDGVVQGFTHSINNPSVLMGAERTLTINSCS